MANYLGRKIIDFANLVKFSHTIFAMPFAFVGFVLGLRESNESFSFTEFLLVVLCMVTARNVAMSFNRISDRAIDKLNPRTANREIPAKVIGLKAAKWFTLINALIFITSTYFINSLCFFLSPVALAVIMGYSYTKRFTWASHLILGVGLALAPIGAYIAVCGRFDLAPIVFSLAVLCWVGGFDIVYALQDEDFDKSNRLFSIPSWFGTRKALMFSIVLHVVSVTLFFMSGFIAHLGYIYYCGTGLFTLLMIMQHLKVKPNDLSKINQVFFVFNGIGSIVFAVFSITDMLFFKK